MATSNVLIHDEMGLRVPSVASVAVVAGAGVTFTADSGADSILYFSQAAVAVLTPAPASPVSLSSGASVAYTFEEPSGQAYGVIVQAPGDPAPTGFDFGPPADPPLLLIQPGEGSSFPGPVQPIKTGR
jgi:hypothetical protein